MGYNVEIKSLASALVKAQSEMGGAKKGVTNTFFKTKYADLSSVAEAISSAAAAHGLGYIQVAHEREHAAAIETIIVHESGETLSCGIVSCPVEKSNAQGYGSAMTYARRYSLAAAFGVCPEDDDGNAAAKSPPKSTVQPTKTGWVPSPEEEKFLSGEIDMIRAKIENEGALSAATYFYREPGLDEEEKLWVWNKLSKSEKDAVRVHRPTQ